MVVGTAKLCQWMHFESQGIVHVSEAFNVSQREELSSLAHHLCGLKGLKKQHEIEGFDDNGVPIICGSANFGVTENAAAHAGEVNCPNKNVHLSGQLLEVLKGKALEKVWSITKGCFSPEAINNMHKFYNCHCTDYPAYQTTKGEATFWNGIQVNMNFNASLHTDNLDVPRTPCVAFSLSVRGATLRVHPTRKQTHSFILTSKFSLGMQP